MTRGAALNGEKPSACASASVVITSRYSGSPMPPGSFVRSSTARVRAPFGSAAMNAVRENGR